MNNTIVTQGVGLNVVPTDSASDMQTTHHNNPRIRHDMDLWQRIKGYDKKSTEAHFIPVLSKKQKKLKLQ